jgi:hypothetical protein
MRSWIWATNSFDGTVMIAKVRSHSPVFGLFQFSQSPASPKGDGDSVGLLGASALDRPPLKVRGELRHRRIP